MSFAACSALIMATPITSGYGFVRQLKELLVNAVGGVIPHGYGFNVILAIMTHVIPLTTNINDVPLTVGYV